MNFSDLPASGFTNTSPISYAWCKYHIDKIREKFGSSIELGLKAHLWAYRHGDTECFSFDIYKDGEYYTMTLEAIGDVDDYLESSDYGVYDLVEALHIVGIFKEALNLDVEIGRRNNEVNKQLLAKPLAANETNGELKPI